MDEVFSDEEVEMDSYTRVHRGALVPHGVSAKPAYTLKDFSCSFYGRYLDNYGDPGLHLGGFNVPILDTSPVTYPGSIQWIPFCPSIGTDVDALTGTDKCLVEGIKFSLHSYLHYSMASDDVSNTFEIQPKVRVRVDIVYVPEVYPYAQFPLGNYDMCNGFFNYLYEDVLDPNFGTTGFLRRERIREGCKIIKSWNYVLDREVYTGTGPEYDDCVWVQAATGIGTALGGENVFVPPELAIPTEVVSVGQKNFIKHYNDQDATYKAKWGPVQYPYWQTRSFYSDDGYLKVNRSVIIKRQPLNYLAAEHCLMRGTFVVMTWSDVTANYLFQNRPYFPTINLNMRFKFSQK